jgi:Domain of unknown function (DUF4260)
VNVVRGLLHLEGTALFLAATWAYFALLDGSWGVYLGCLLLPDLGMVGYLRGPRLGAWTYNLLHTEALAFALLTIALATDSRALLAAALILAAHIGMDRALGYGLKFTSGFKDTHLQKVTDA